MKIKLFYLAATAAPAIPLALAFPLTAQSAAVRSTSSEALVNDPLPASFSLSRPSSDGFDDREDIDPLTNPPALSAPAFAVSKRPEIPAPGERATRPFKSLAVGFTAGFSGFGFDLATPLADRYNLRVGASYMDISAGFHVQGVPTTGTIHFASARAIIDYAPTGRSFHISPGLTFYNRDHFVAALYVQGAQTIVFNDQTYISDPADPLHGIATVKLANRPAPRLTVGWGNMIRHRTAYFTFPVEFGVEYINPPHLNVGFGGSTCTPQGVCTQVSADPSTQQNIIQNQVSVNNDLRPLRFFPIFSFGVSYKFGH